MRSVLIIAGREFRSYLISPIAYLVAGVFLLFVGGAFSIYLAGTGYSDTSIRGFVDAAPLLILPLSVLLTMRLIAEERKLGTWELLLTAPLREWAVVLGKYLACLGVFILMLALTLLYPFLLILFGDPDLGPIGTSYVGLLLLGVSAIAVGVFASATTSNQLVAAIVSGGILLALWFLGGSAELLPDGLARALNYLSLSRRLPEFERGVIDSRSVVYYLSVASVFLYFASRAIQADRWR